MRGRGYRPGDGFRGAFVCLGLLIAAVFGFFDRVAQRSHDPAGFIIPLVIILFVCAIAGQLIYMFAKKSFGDERINRLDKIVHVVVIVAMMIFALAAAVIYGKRSTEQYGQISEEIL